MNLLNAVNGFRLNRLGEPSFGGFRALADACERYRGATRSTEQFEARLKRILSVVYGLGASQLKRSDRRFVLASVAATPLITVDVLSKVLHEIEQRKEKWLFQSAYSALLASYDCAAFRNVLRPFVKKHSGELRVQSRKFVEKSRILDSDAHLLELGKRIAQCDDIRAYALEIALEGNVIDSTYGSELKLAAVRQAVSLRDPSSLEKVINWVFGRVTGTPLAEYYEAMLSPFLAINPESKMQKLITSVLVERFRDPRIYPWPGLPGDDGSARRDACVGTLRRWLSVEYLELFMKIIDATAVDRMWKDRRAFWLGYFAGGYVSDVTLILASDANRMAHQLKSDMEAGHYMKWSRLSGAGSDQSVLLMQIGDMTIADWSHAGAMRFWRTRDSHAPAHSRTEYLARNLRQYSIRVLTSPSETLDAIRHVPPGQWQRRAAYAIKHYTGVSV